MYLPIKQKIKKETIQIKWFIDLDHKENILYNNLYLSDSRVLTEIALVSKEENHPNIKIQRFSITDITYLTAY